MSTPQSESSSSEGFPQGASPEQPQFSPPPAASTSPSNPPFPQGAPPGQPYVPPTAPAQPPFPNTPTPPPAAPVYGGGYGQPARQYGRSAAASEDQTWAMFSHLSAGIGALVSVGWLSFVGPLIIYVAKKDSSPFVRNAAAGAFNFALSMAIASIVGLVLTVTVVLAVIGIPLMVVGAVLPIVLGIIGAVKASKGEAYTYPFQLKVLS